MTPAMIYLRTQVIANILINLVLNGLIAFFSFHSTENIPVAEMAVDSLITVLIISFLVAWIAVPTVRREIAKGKVSPPTLGFRKGWGLHLPQNAAARAGILMLLLVLGFGGVLLSGAYYLLFPGGLSGNAYFILKAIYAGGCAGLAAAAAIFSVFAEVPITSEVLS